MGGSMESYGWVIHGLAREGDWLIVVCVVTALTSLPLALRLVPPNCIYGFRTRFTRSSRAVWFDANAFVGRAMLAASLVSAFLLLAVPVPAGDAGGSAGIVLVPTAPAPLARVVHQPRPRPRPV